MIAEALRARFNSSAGPHVVVGPQVAHRKHLEDRCASPQSGPVLVQNPQKLRASKRKAAYPRRASASEACSPGPPSRGVLMWGGGARHLPERTMAHDEDAELGIFHQMRVWRRV